MSIFCRHVNRGKDSPTPSRNSLRFFGCRRRIQWHLFHSLIRWWQTGKWNWLPMNIRFNESVFSFQRRWMTERVTEWQLFSALLAHHQQRKVSFKASFLFSMYREKEGSKSTCVSVPKGKLPYPTSTAIYTDSIWSAVVTHPIDA